MLLMDMYENWNFLIWNSKHKEYYNYSIAYMLNYKVYNIKIMLTAEYNTTPTNYGTKQTMVKKTNNN